MTSSTAIRAASNTTNTLCRVRLHSRLTWCRIPPKCRSRRKITVNPGSGSSKKSCRRIAPNCIASSAIGCWRTAISKRTLSFGNRCSQATTVRGLSRPKKCRPSSKPIDHQTFHCKGNGTMKFKESAMAHKLLDGLEGLEIGGSAHNAFGLKTRNVDYCGDMTVFKEEEIK